jgi:hypothetical protein
MLDTTIAVFPRNALPVPARKIGSPPWLQEVTSEGHL